MKVIAAPLFKPGQILIAFPKVPIRCACKLMHLAHNDRSCLAAFRADRQVWLMVALDLRLLESDYRWVAAALEDYLPGIYDVRPLTLHRQPPAQVFLISYEIVVSRPEANPLFWPRVSPDSEQWKQEMRDAQERGCDTWEEWEEMQDDLRQLKTLKGKNK